MYMHITYIKLSIAIIKHMNYYNQITYIQSPTQLYVTTRVDNGEKSIELPYRLSKITRKVVSD